MLALIITVIALFIYCIIAERWLKRANEDVLNLRMRLKKEGIDCE